MIVKNRTQIPQPAVYGYFNSRVVLSDWTSHIHDWSEAVFFGKHPDSAKALKFKVIRLLLVALSRFKQNFLYPHPGIESKLHPCVFSKVKDSVTMCRRLGTVKVILKLKRKTEKILE